MVNGFCQGTIVVIAFSMVFLISESLLSMVFFFSFQPLVSMGFQWFFVWQTIGTNGSKPLVQLWNGNDPSLCSINLVCGGAADGWQAIKWHSPKVNIHKFPSEVT